MFSLQTYTREVWRKKGKWLCEHAANLFDQYVSDSVTELGDAHQVLSDQLEQEALPCRFSSCTRVFKYAKCRTNHEKSKHGLVLNDAEQAPTVPKLLHSNQMKS